ncbi:hypothetical protein [Pseudorhizobium flavum]|jgi:hypothetical protein|uniref:hypothetical protein n=1 Tax=Pseudorhizobium flavum TaxID=1335061 RepID=UPI0037707864
MEAAKTLYEMTARERLDLIETVAVALEDRAEEALQIGCQIAASNNFNLAAAIRGLVPLDTSDDLASAELLLQIGINYCVAPEPDVHGRVYH